MTPLQAHSAAVISAQGIKVAIGGKNRLDIPALDFIGPGVSAIIGPNGAGKSLLLTVLAGVRQPSSGQVSWIENGQISPVRANRPRIGYAEQHPRGGFSSGRATLRKALVGLDKATREARINAAITAIGIEDTGRWTRWLSVGGRQQIAVAAALITEPALALLDEPTASLDPVHTRAVENLILQARQRGARVVLVSHDLTQVARIADEVLVLSGGALVERGLPQDVLRAPQHPATRMFLGM